jgi:hypothetical protein
MAASAPPRTTVLPPCRSSMPCRTSALCTISLQPRGVSDVRPGTRAYLCMKGDVCQLLQHFVGCGCSHSKPAIFVRPSVRVSFRQRLNVSLCCSAALAPILLTSMTCVVPAC